MIPPVFDKDASAWPVGTDSFFQPRRVAFWVLAALIVNGLFYTLHLFFMGVRVVPVTALLGLVVWGLYTLVFLQVFRTLDLLEQHPPEAFVLAFAWGGMGAVYFSAPANIAIQSLCAKLVSPEFVAVWGPAVAGPITEEFLKLAGVILLVLVARNQFQTYLSVLIVGAMTGLGFQVTENLIHTVNASMHFPLENQVAPVFINLLTRGLLSGLWSHAAYTTIASFGIAWFLLHPEKPRVVRIAVAFLCFALAWAMHFVWNSPFLEDLFDGGYGEMAVLLAVKGIPVVIAAGLFWRVAARENGTYLHALAAYFVPERELIRDDEWVRIGAPMQRYKVRREIGWTFGWRARRLKTRLQREQLRLIRKAGTYGRGAQTLRHEVAVRRLRAQLEPLIAVQP
ncbi:MULTISPECIES: PrsW family intramembrane metalloprotease [unclassified Variovorax]|uniref:PrsW family intramembrane metalloprotease n=1 Tax=unclassified Variovorax TaxID=663243 RepID=UPI0008D6AD4E|nr:MULTISPECIES: PrsW family intramembrane metalloprotease [unclassified Variovorax]SEK15752.1 Membrane proteinase PrsW, cleaves anti-sigma factor RsiW, M82 family [Variovorax sp. OK202]SFE20956.1 Membrane proteinase PrsW, cleaves anti-sigma factor RsiW, M82 family [Variovorax sp. OK212]